MTINHLGGLKPDKRNARKHNLRNISMVEHSLETDGFGRSILIDAEGNILAGNGVTEAAGNVGLEDVIVVPSDGTKVIAIQRTDVQPGSERAIRLAIADNRTQELSEFDPAVLAELSAEVDLSAFWFDDELSALLADAEAPSEPGVDPGPDFGKADALVEQYGVAVGQIWQMGDHRLAVGDCTDGELVARLMNGALAEMVWTDPPYAVSYRGGSKPRDAIENDDMSADEMQSFLYACFAGLLTHCENGGAWYVAAPPGPLHTTFGIVLRELGIHHQTLIWVKNNATFGPMGQDYHWRHEPIFYGWKPGAAHRYRGDRKQETVLEFDRPVRSDEHPTMKPVDLIAQCIVNSSDEESVILEPFCGSGSTMIAAEQTGRICYAAEIEPRYAAVCLKRWADMSGKAPVLVS